MSVRAEIAPELILWAADRSGKPRAALLKSFPSLPAWEAGTTLPTFNQLESFARATYTPVGYFFLPSPPTIELPIPDLRTKGSGHLEIPGPNLLDTIAICMDRQEWYRSYLIEQGEDPLPFVGSLSRAMPVREAAAKMQATLDFALDDRATLSSGEDAFRTLATHAEEAGVLVMVAGVVGSDTHRKLDPEEFRGFALADPYAPVVFVNGADAKSAQIFTLAHELVHIWLGSSAITDGGDRISRGSAGSDLVEYWVNAVAGELLIPTDVLLQEFQRDIPLPDETRRLSRRFKVSAIVVLRRLVDARQIDWNAYRETEKLLAVQMTTDQSKGGNFYNTAPVRASKRFTRAVVTSTLEGRTLYRDAFRLLGFKSQKAFDGLSHELGLA